MSDCPGMLETLHSIPELAGTWSVEARGDRTFRLQRGSETYFAKWILAGDQRGQNELDVNRTVLAGAPLSVPRLLQVIPCGADRLALWEWVDGPDLRNAGRELLPGAFRQLGAFHASRRSSGPLTSPATDLVYASLPAFVEGETQRLCVGLSPKQQQACARILRRLECGYPTVIHGDLHPGNLCAASRGIVFLDWGYSRRSLNLLDLDYVRSQALRPPETDWWVIRPEEAGPVLEAYFAACGLPEVDVLEVHQAVMLWALLWSRFNSTRSGKLSERSPDQQRLDDLLEVKA